MPASPCLSLGQNEGKGFPFVGGVFASVDGRRRRRRRFFDRVSLPSRQKPGQDGISTALFCPIQVSILDFCAGWHCSAAEKISNRFPKPVSDKAESPDRSRPWAPYSLRLRNGN
jgi:hypothetical protein